MFVKKNLGGFDGSPGVRITKALSFLHFIIRFLLCTVALSNKG